ncbi:MAG: hypothetical protein ABL903_15975 [Methylococcales bacterium]
MTKKNINFLVLTVLISFNVPTFAAEEEGLMANCLKAWGNHPFGNNPKYKTLATNVKVFGIGEDPKDSEVTDSPSLVMVNPGVNVMGGTTIELLNPNGWYCFKSQVNVMGGLTIKAHCKAHLASATGGTTVLGSDSNKKSVTVMGSTEIELVGCEK